MIYKYDTEQQGNSGEKKNKKIIPHLNYLYIGN